MDVSSREYTREEALEIMKHTYDQIMLMFKQDAPPLAASCNKAVLMCIDGSLAGVGYSRYRGFTGKIRNYNFFKSYSCPWDNTMLHHRAVEWHSDLDYDVPRPAQFTSTYLTFASNQRRKSKETTHGHAWPCEDLRENNYYIVGGLIGMVEWAKNNPNYDKTQMMIEFADIIFNIMRQVKDSLGGDVFFLGAGIALDHPTLGKYVHSFHSQMMKRIKSETSTSYLRYPSVFYHDIYTPDAHEQWDDMERPTSVDGTHHWSQEPEAWITRFDKVFRRYVQVQCVASAERRKRKERDETRRQSGNGSAFSRRTSNRRTYTNTGYRGNGRGAGRGTRISVPMKTGQSSFAD